MIRTVWISGQPRCLEIRARDDLTLPSTGMLFPLKRPMMEAMKMAEKMLTAIQVIVDDEGSI